MNVVTREDRVLREARRRAERNRRVRLIVIGIAIPTLVALIYYAFIARAEYKVVMKFTVQGVSAPVTPDLLSGFGLPSASPQADNGHIIIDYVKSPEMVRALRANWGFDDAFRGPTLDPVGYIAKNAPIETKTEFWASQTQAIYDATSNVIEVDVLAFSKADSVRLAQGVLSNTENLVNSLNSKVRDEAIKVAQRQLDDRAREFAEARAKLVQVRARSTVTLDAETQAQAAMVGALDQQLASARVDRAAAQATYLPGSPQMKALDERVASLESQRAAATAKLQGGAGQNEASRDITSQTALLDYENAQKAFVAAQGGLQQAISTRDNERRYVVAYLPPRPPEASNYWDRFANVLAVALFSMLLMGIFGLSYSVVKDHLQ